MVCTATLGSRNGEFRLEVVLRLDPSLKIRTPLRAFPSPIDHFPRVGVDLFPKLIQSGFLKLDDGLPVAQSIVFGWTVSGVCKEE
ncbi:hypothetical protein KR032_001792 [Drosophila birchii]|nr:hypothetical protein KR032_001792 [Drosophila birchii]